MTVGDRASGTVRPVEQRPVTPVARERFAVFGSPLSHTLSPKIHRAYAAQFGKTIDFRSIEVTGNRFPAALATFAAAGGRGANLTSPLKEGVLPLCRELSARAARCGSVNTLVRNHAGWYGDTTDGAGLLRDLAMRANFDPSGARILLFGAGGAARAVAFALLDAGAGFLFIANRTPERAEALATALGPRSRAVPPDAIVMPFDLAINATTAGHCGIFPWPRIHARWARLAVDLSYGNAAGPFLAWAAESGITTATDGLGMLVEQAAESFAIWHGRRPDTDSVYSRLRGGA